MCHTCSGIASKCTCMPKKNLFVQPSIPSLFFYHPDTARAESKVIYTLKHKNSRDVFEFISEELCKKLEALLDENGKNLLEEYDKLGEKLVWRLCDTAYADGKIERTN